MPPTGRRASELAEARVELERRNALLKQQATHIADLNAALTEALEAKRQHTLAAAAGTPAKARALLARAAADNSTLCRRVDEMRAQRDVLAVSKAALTAQLSELIQLVADDRQGRDEGWRVQLRQLCALVGRPDLEGEAPEDQLGAVAAHVLQAKQECRELRAQLQALQQPAAAAGTASPHPSPAGKQGAATRAAGQRSIARLHAGADAAAGAGAAAGRLASPAGHIGRVDQAATGQLLSSDDAAAPAASADSFRTVRSALTELSQLSPLALGVPPGSHRTPGAAAATAAAAGGCLAAAGELASPLSSQSLSFFSQQTPGSGLAPRVLDLSPASATPVSRFRLPQPPAAAASPSGGRHTPTLTRRCSSGTSSQGSDDAAQAAMTPRLQAAIACGLAGEQAAAGCSLDRLLHAVMAPSPMGTPLAAQLEQELGAGSTSSSAAAAATRGRRCGSNSAAAPAAGLCLEPGFRLAAVSSLWASPGLGVAAAAGEEGQLLHARGDGMASHVVWVSDGEQSAAASPAPSARGSPLPAVVPGDGAAGSQRRRRRLLVAGLCLGMPALAAAALAKQCRAEELATALGAAGHTLACAAQQAQHGAARAWTHVANLAGRARQHSAGGEDAGACASQQEVEVEAGI